MVAVSAGKLDATSGVLSEGPADQLGVAGLDQSGPDHHVNGDRLGLRRTSAPTNQCSIQSAHFSTCPSVPHGITGTEEVEFFGEPSISLSEYTM
jgi:hypothetical protein